MSERLLETEDVCLYGYDSVCDRVGALVALGLSDLRFDIIKWERKSGVLCVCDVPVWDVLCAVFLCIPSLSIRYR